MSTLIVRLAPRPRTPGAAASADLRYVLSNDGLTITGEGSKPAALLPRAETVIAVVGDSDVSWHRITLPRVGAPKMRAALIGLLEESLLDDEASQHLALQPEAVPGQSAWVAAISKPWLQGELAALEKARVFVDRVVPSSWPDAVASGHFDQSHDANAPGEMTLCYAHAGGVLTLPVRGGGARALLPERVDPNGRWSANPSVAAPAERWLGAPVVVMSGAERALLSSRSLWNLRQFDLAAKARGSRMLADLWRRVRGPSWRPARIGLGLLLVAQLVGLNLWAWRQQGAIEAKRRAMNALLVDTYPQVRSVLDAPLQMQRETDAIRAAAGRSGEADLEPLLAAASAAWPPNRPPLETLRYEPGRLTLAAKGWSDDQIGQFSQQLRAAGWRVETAEGRMTVSRDPAAAGGAAS